MYKYLFFFFIGISLPVLSQNPEIDSLLKEATKSASRDDSANVHIFNSISREYMMIGGFDKSLIYAGNALKVSLINKPARWAKVGEARAYNNIAIVYNEQGELDKAFEYYSKSLNIYQQLNDKKGLTGAYCNLGLLYFDKGDYAKSLEYQFKSLKMEEELGNKQGIGDSYGNIGLVYHEKGELEKALEYQLRSLKIDEELADKSKISISCASLGNIYSELGSMQEALKYYNRAKSLAEETGDMEGIAGSYGNIGIIYQQMADFKTAIEYHHKALSIFEEIGDKRGVVETYRNLGVLYLSMKNAKESRRYMRKSLELASETTAMWDVMVAYQGIATADSVLGDYKSAYTNHKQYTRVKDSLFNAEVNKKSVQSEMNFEFEKKEQAAKMEQEKKDALALEEINKQTMQRNGFIAGFALMLTLAGVSFRSYRNKRKSHALIAHQKELVEEKNKDILDSINYAKRIQQALLLEEEHISSVLPQHFILFKPKDIVSGDFYWSHEKNGYIYIAAADCTGHGVPGAFMSMLGIAFLNEITANEKLLSPGEILNILREKIIVNLRQTGKSGESKDGMDISMLRLNPATGEVLWAGANNPVWIINSNTKELKEIKGDKQPIGFSDHQKLFTDHAFGLEKEETIYIFTDGYADQFGGEKGKKFKYSQMKELLIRSSLFSMSEQKEILNKTFEEWRSELEQVDDVCVIGVRAGTK
jgi:tetratricopeptide (TPR) repeat protein